MRKLYISWDLLIEKGKELMEFALQEGNKPDLISELVGWLDAVLFEYGYDHDIIIEGSDFKTYKITSYEDIEDFIEAYREDLDYDNDLILEELLNQ